MSPGEIGAMDAALGTAAEEARAIYLLGLASAGQVPDEGETLPPAPERALSGGAR